MEREAPREILAADHIKNRNNGRKLSECIPAKVPLVPSNCRKRVQPTMSLGKKLQHMTGPLRLAQPYKRKHKKIMSDFVETNTNDDGIVEIENSGSRKNREFMSHSLARNSSPDVPH
jgi:hypothetical protein